MATEVFKGSTSRTTYFELVDSTTGLPRTGIVFGDVTGSYVRTRAARTAITMATLASASAAWSSGGFILVDDANQPGVYRLDVPDAAFATGVEEVVVTIKATGCRTVSRGFVLVDWNKQVASVPNAAAGASGGLPTADASNAVKVQSGTGANQISLNSGLVTLAAVTHTGATIPTVTTTGTATAVTTVNGLAAGVITAASIAANAITAAKIATDAIGDAQVATDVVTAIQSGLATSATQGTLATAVAGVKTVADAILVDTAELQGDWANGGRLDLILDNAAVKTGVKLASDGLDSVAVETGVNARQALAMIGAAAAGKASGLDTATATYYAMGASGTSTARIVAVTDSDGNRTATTLTLPA